MLSMNNSSRVIIQRPLAVECFSFHHTLPLVVSRLLFALNYSFEWLNAVFFFFVRSFWRSVHLKLMHPQSQAFLISLPTLQVSSCWILLHWFRESKTESNFKHFYSTGVEISDTEKYGINNNWFDLCTVDICT